MNNQTIDIGRALIFMFEEEDWVGKFLVAVLMVLLSILIIPYIILQGYGIEIIRRVGRGQTPELPQWDDWGKYLSDGFMAAVAFFVYTLPVILLSCCFALFSVGLSDNQSGELGGAATLLLCCLVLITLLVQIPLYLIYYAGLTRYAESGNIASFFQFGQLWNLIRQNMGKYGYAIVVVIVANFIGGFVPILGQAWAILASNHALGQFLRLMRGGATEAEAEPVVGV